MPGPLDTQLPSALHSFKSCCAISNAVNFVLYGAYITWAVLSLCKVYSLPFITKCARRWISISILATTAFYTTFVLSISINLYAVLSSPGTPQMNGSALAVALTSMTLMSAWGDAVFTYKCWIIWQSSRLVCIPVILLAVECGLLITSDIKITLAHHMQLTTDRMSVAGMTMSVVLNVILAMAAIARLLYACCSLRAAVRSVLPDAGRHYISLARLLAVSAALYTAVYIALIVARHETGSLVVIMALYFVQASLPLLVLLHVDGHSRAPTVTLPELSIPAHEVLHISGGMELPPRVSIGVSDDH